MKYVFTWENFAWPAGLANSWHRPQQLTPFWCWPVNSPPLFTNPWKGSSYHLYIKNSKWKKRVSLLKILKIYKWDHTVAASQLGEQFGWVLNHGKWAFKPKSSRAMAAGGLQSKMRPRSVHSGTASPADWWLVPTSPWPRRFQVTGLVSPVQ